MMGRAPVIVRQRVAEVTLRLIDDEGLDAVSIERIASELGVRGPSLYHHFADKAAILTEVARLVLGDLDLERPGDDWQQWMLETSMALYRRVLEHPNAAVILLQFLPDNSAVPGFGRASQLLTAAGVEPALQLLLMEGTEKMAWGWALQRAVAAEHSNRLKPSSIPKRFPELAASVRENRWDDEGLVEASLRAFMQGVIDGHVAAPSRPSRARRNGPTRKPAPRRKSAASR
jgi:AcrR family transcriptional regulator